MTDKIWGNDWYMRFSENLSFLSGDDDSGLSHFSVSAPASDAEFMCVSIENTFPSPSSKWAVMKGRKWQVFEQDEAGVVLYPIHDCCLHIMAQTSRRNSRQANKSSTAFANVQSYYQAMLRLHLRNTIGEGWDFAPFGLEWEHQYYGAQEFADGFSWSSCPGWEVSQTLSTTPFSSTNSRAHLLC
jgi:hypothetical protein